MNPCTRDLEIKGREMDHQIGEAVALFAAALLVHRAKGQRDQKLLQAVQRLLNHRSPKERLCTSG